MLSSQLHLPRTEAPLPQLRLPLDAFLGGLALELPGLPLLKFWGPFPGSDRPPSHPGGRPDLGLGQLQVHGQAGRDPTVAFGFWTPSHGGLGADWGREGLSQTS